MFIELLFIVMIAVIIVLFLQKNKQNERISRLELDNKRLSARFDTMLDKNHLQELDSKGESSTKPIKSNPQDLCKSFESSASKAIKNTQDVHISALDSSHAIAQKLMSKNTGANLAQRFGLDSKNPKENLRESTKYSNQSEESKQDSHEATQDLNYKISQDSQVAPKATTKPINSSTIERFLAQKAMIILGGIFFALAGYFCIRYSIEHNLITPRLRIAGACAFGVLLFALGFAFDSLKCAKLATFKGESTANLPKLPIMTRLAQKIVRVLSLSPAMSARIAQTLIGSSIVIEFFSIYGGYALYAFFGNVLGFALLCVVSFGALFLTLRFGLIVGTFGLLGGFATPFLIDAQNPNFYLLCGYLLALHSCVLYIWRKKSAIIPLLSSIALLGYMVIFANTASLATPPLGESIFALFVCCVVFFTLFILLERVFCKSKPFEAILFALVGILGFFVLIEITNPKNIAHTLFGFGFVALLCAICAFVPLLNALDSHSGRFMQFFSKGLKNPKILDYGAVFGLVFGSAYMGAFISALPNYCIITLEAIFGIAFIANALFSDKKSFYLMLLLVVGAVFGLLEFYQTTLMFSNIAMLGICAFIYGFISAKNLVDSRAIRSILSLNAISFFGAIFVLSQHFAPHSAMYYFYLFCTMWVLAFFLLCAPQILRKGDKIRLCDMPDLIFIGAILFICATFALLGKFGIALFYNIFGKAHWATLGLTNYGFFALCCVLNLLLLARYCKDNLCFLSDKDGIFALSRKDFLRFCDYFKSVIFATLLVLILAVLGAIVARIYYALGLNEIAFIDDALYFIAGAGIFSILALACAKLINRALYSSANLATDLGTNLNATRTKALKCAFFLLGIKSLWLYILTLFGWRDIFYESIYGIAQAQFYYLAHTIFAYSTLSLLGFVPLFVINGAFVRLTTSKFLRYCIDFLALSLLICGTIGVIHCAFGVEGDINFSEGGFIYRFATNGANELYAYSAGLVCVSVALLAIGIKGQVERFKHYCFAMLCIIALKVFFIDTASFSSLGKVALFVFMGVAFIGIAVVYNKFVLRRES